MKIILAALLCLSVALAGFAADTASINFQWNRHRDRKVVGYKLYQRTIPSVDYVQVKDVGNVTSYTLQNIPRGHFYLYQITAYTAIAIESPPSNAVPVILLPTSTPTPTPAGSFIALSPSTITFVATAGTIFPAPQSIQVTPSSGVAWVSHDTSPWFDTSPTNHGNSGDSCILTPHTDGLAPGNYAQNLTFTAPGCPDRTVVVTLVLN